MSNKKMTSDSPTQFDTTIYSFNDKIPEKQALIERYKITGTGENETLVLIKGNFEEKDHELLKNIIGALNLQFDEVLKIHLKEEDDIQFASITRHFFVNYAIIFGAEPSELKLNVDIHKYDVVNFNKIKFLFADNLNKFNEQKELKRQLWEKLQDQFEIKNRSK